MGAGALYIRHLLMNETDDTRLRKLKFRAWRRGFREADLILGPFADKHVASFTDLELDTFETLLDQPDPDLYDWILGRTPTPADFDHDIMNRIKAFRDIAYSRHKGEQHGG
jgi:antitoxin CptB